MPIVVGAVVIGAAIVAGAWLFRAPFAAAERRNEQHLAWLRSAPIEELAVHVVGLVRRGRWDALDAGRAIVERKQWTERALLDAIVALTEATGAEDAATGQHGRESHAFELHDSGMIAVLEALRGRVGPAPLA